MIRHLLRTAAVAVLPALIPLTLVAQEWRVAEPGYPWAWPSDHRAHPGYRTEWWYFTGDLAGGGRSLGYQFTVFRVGLTPRDPELDSPWNAADLVMGHLAITDRDAGTHHFSEVLWRANGALGGFPDAGATVAWARAPAGSTGQWSVEWTEEGWTIRAHDDRRALAIDLALGTGRGPVLQGEAGFSRKSADGRSASLYHSFTRQPTTGTAVVAGDTVTVSGESWMDREFGSGQLATDQVGWDWFALRLDDGRDLMVYLLRDSTGAVSHASGTLLDAGGQRHLDRDDLEVEALAHWESEQTGARYPVRWAIRLPAEDVDLRVEGVVPSAENVSRLVPRLAYWEGPVRVTDAAGNPTGRGYMELTGYGNSIQPVL